MSSNIFVMQSENVGHSMVLGSTSVNLNPISLNYERDTITLERVNNSQMPLFCGPSQLEAQIQEDLLSGREFLYSQGIAENPAPISNNDEELPMTWQASTVTTIDSSQPDKSNEAFSVERNGGYSDSTETFDDKMDSVESDGSATIKNVESFDINNLDPKDIIFGMESVDIIEATPVEPKGNSYDSKTREFQSFRKPPGSTIPLSTVQSESFLIDSNTNQIQDASPQTQQDSPSEQLSTNDILKEKTKKQPVNIFSGTRAPSSGITFPKTNPLFVSLSTEDLKTMLERLRVLRPNIELMTQILENTTEPSNVQIIEEPVQDENEYDFTSDEDEATESQYYLERYRSYETDQEMSGDLDGDW